MKRCFIFRGFLRKVRIWKSGYFDILSKYDDSENPYDAYPTTTAQALREDEIVPGLEMHDVKNINKGNFVDGYFQVPKVLGEGA